MPLAIDYIYPTRVTGVAAPDAAHTPLQPYPPALLIIVSRFEAANFTVQAAYFRLIFGLVLLKLLYATFSTLKGLLGIL